MGCRRNGRTNQLMLVRPARRSVFQPPEQRDRFPCAPVTRNDGLPGSKAGKRPVAAVRTSRLPKPVMPATIRARKKVTDDQRQPTLPGSCSCGERPDKKCPNWADPPEPSPGGASQACRQQRRRCDGRGRSRRYLGKHERLRLVSLDHQAQRSNHQPQQFEGQRNGAASLLRSP